MVIKNGSDNWGNKASLNDRSLDNSEDKITQHRKTGPMIKPTPLMHPIVQSILQYLISYPL